MPPPIPNPSSKFTPSLSPSSALKVAGLMEKASESPLKERNQSENKIFEQKTPPTNNKTAVNTMLGGLNGTPDRLTVPKAFKHPERYMSPTDHMISPVSKGLILARNRRATSLLPPSLNQPFKNRDLQSEDTGKTQQKKDELTV